MIFDLYGTLVDVRTDETSPAFWARWCHLLGERAATLGEVWTPEPRTLRHDLEAARRHQLETLGRELHTPWPDAPYEVVFSRVFRSHGLSGALADQPDFLASAARAYREASRDYIFPYPATLPVLDELRVRGFGVWLLSNAQEGFTLPELHALDLYRRFDGVAISSVEGYAKPAPEFMQALLDRHGLDREACLFVGNDLHTDLGVGEQSGVATVYFHSNHSEASWLPAARQRTPHLIPDGDMRRLLALLEGGSLPA